MYVLHTVYDIYSVLQLDRNSFFCSVVLDKKKKYSKFCLCRYKSSLVIEENAYVFKVHITELYNKELMTFGCVLLLW